MGKLYFKHFIRCNRCEPDKAKRALKMQTRSFKRQTQNPSLSCKHCGNKQIDIKFKAKMSNLFDVKDKTVGSASLNYERKRTWILENVFVSPKFREQGIGRKMLLRVLEIGRISRRIRLEVCPFGKVKGPNVFHLMKFYESIGFEGDENEMVLKC